MGDCVILHVSDIHVGRSFDEVKWDSLRQRVAETDPQLIVVTGDVVNSPWRGALKKAAKHLEELRTRPDEPGSAATHRILVLVPGNHDTRWSGILPLNMLWLFAAFFAACALVSFLYLDAPAWARLAVTGGAAAGALFCAIVRLLLTSNLDRYLGEWLLRTPRRFDELGVGIVPFDSATKGLFWGAWARGYVDEAGFTQAQKKVRASDELFWIAAVHHHPLPMPYDDKHEKMMIMDNAGAFLSELSKRDVRLVLHGHKHHPHFARIAIDPMRADSIALAVLSAGTPTERKSQGNSSHGFNVIRVRADYTASVERFEAQLTEPTFRPTPEFELEPRESIGWIRNVDALARNRLTADSLLVRVSIVPDGDTRFRREYRGVRAVGKAVRAVEPRLTVATTGHLDGIEAGCLSSNFECVELEKEDPTPHSLKARISFVRPGSEEGLQPGVEPIDFFTQFYANNGVAMWADELPHMYPAETRRQDETLSFRMLDMCLDEARFVVEFPAGYPSPPSLSFKVIRDGREEAVALRRSSVTRLQGAAGDTIWLAAVAYPWPGDVYRLTWPIPGRGVSEDDGQDRAQAAELAKWLLGDAARVHAEALRALLRQVAAWVQQNMGGQGSTSASYDVALYAYDSAACKLRRCLNLQPDGRDGWCFAYGNGLPGRAFKTMKMSVFQKHRVVGPPWQYLPGDGTVVQDLKDIQEHIVLALPLVTPALRADRDLDARTPGAAYGVLEISTRSGFAWIDTKPIPLHACATVANNMVLERLRTYT